MDQHFNTFESAADADGRETANGEDLLDRAIAEGDFAYLLTRFDKDYSGQRPLFSLEDVETAAREHGLMEEYERDEQIAPLMLQTSLLLDRISAFAGVQYSLGHGGYIYEAVPRRKGPDGSVLIASPLVICGVGYNSDHAGPQLHVKIQTETGVWIDRYLPRASMLASNEFYAQIKSLGIRTAKPSSLVTLLSIVEPDKKFRTYEHSGWNRDDFVLPNGEVLSRSVDTSVETRCTFKSDARYQPSGSEQAADEMLSLVENDAFIVSAIANVLAAPLIKDMGLPEPGGIHFYGSSTIGKTTTLFVAASLQGRGELRKKDGGGIVESWNTTAHQAEKTIGRFNDMAVCIDEAQQITNMSDLRRVIYSVNAGSSKAAAMGFQGEREVYLLRSPMLSTGEFSLQQMIESDQKSGGKYGGGAETRVNDIPFEGFSYVPERFSSAGEFADFLRDTAKTHYGHHLRKLVIAIIQDRAGAIARIKELINSPLICDALPIETVAQLGRVNQRYRFLASVLEFAIESSILPWKSGSGARSLGIVFKVWKEQRGNDHSHEQNKALRTFEETIFKHRSRIQRAGNGKPEPDYESVPSLRLALWKEGVYYFTESGLEEACGGKGQAAIFLKFIQGGHSEKWGLRMDKDGQGKRKQCKTPKGYNLPTRAYGIVDKEHDPANTVDSSDGSIDANEQFIRDPMPASRK